MNTIKILVATVLAVSFGFGGIRAAEEGHEGHNHGEGEHKAAEKKEREDSTKTLITAKDVVEIVVLHNAKRGSITLTILDPKDKPLKPAKAPRLNLIVDGKRKQVKTAACEKTKAGNVFEAEDELLKAKKLTGEVSVKIGEKRLKINLDPHFGHNHAPGEGHH